MAKTIYQPENAEFSDKAHIAARTKLYPYIFNKHHNQLLFENISSDTSPKGRILDGEMGVDRLLKVTVPDLRNPLVFTVQERFRRPSYAKFKDITITEWNNASNQPSELYKINAGIFLYGYYDINTNAFIDAIAINTTDLLIMLAKQQIEFSSNSNQKQQNFLTFKFDDLYKADLVLYQLSKQQELPLRLTSPS